LGKSPKGGRKVRHQVSPKADGRFQKAFSRFVEAKVQPDMRASHESNKKQFGLLQCHLKGSCRPFHDGAGILLG
jgi:hypothetical protein